MEHSAQDLHFIASAFGRFAKIGKLPGGGFTRLGYICLYIGIVSVIGYGNIMCQYYQNYFGAYSIYYLIVPFLLVVP